MVENLFYLQSMIVNLKFLKYPISLIVIVVTLGGCFQSDYTKVVKSELAKGVRMDSVIFGIYLGNTRHEFYGQCFNLNKQRLVTEGPDGATVQYLFTDSLVHEQPTNMRLLFIPRFDEKDVIAELNLEFSYIGWAPWNENLQADK